MESNPVKQRIFTLTELWRESVLEKPDVRMFCWVGNSSVDYKMIQAFAMFHMSDESTLNDIFFLFGHPFNDEKNILYGKRLINDLGKCIKVWNNNPELIKQTGMIQWEPLATDIKFTDEEYFVNNINKLADKLKTKEKEDCIVVSVFPQTVNSFSKYAFWLSNVLRADISSKVRLMIYDTYDLKAFDTIAKQFPSRFQKLYPDLNMYGAMNQILEEAKNGKKSKDERDAVSLQQLILKLSEAIGQNDKRLIEIYQKQTEEITKEHNWPHLEALVCYFIHSYFVANDQQDKAHELLDNAILKADKAVNEKIVTIEEIKYHYRIAKGNLYFINKKFENAVQVYKDCLQIDRTCIDKQVLFGIYQMLAVSLSHSGKRKEAWSYFLDGWKLVENEPQDFIKNNMQVKYYAKDMISTSDEREPLTKYYFDLFSSYWGKDWIKDLKNFLPGTNGISRIPAIH